MAVTGSFVADFSQFQTAVKQAEVSLKSFETGGSKVETQLSKLTNSLSGTKLIQDATLMAEAVERVGGVSMLTEKELARVSAQAKEAAAKLTAMGRDVPPGLQKIADEAKKVDDVHGSMIGTLKNVAAGFVAMFTARAAFNFVNQTISEASALKDLGQQTHINVEELQVLAGAMSEFGVEADTLGKGLFTLSRKIAGGDESVANGLHLMGMSLKDVDGLNGRELFLKIMDGLSTLQGGLRDDTASEIFGSRLGMAMAGASEGIRGAIATWERLNHVASKESVDAMDQYDESIKRASKSLSAMAANMIGPVAQGFNTVVEAATKAGTIQTFWAMMKDGVGSSGPLSQWIFGTDNLATLLDKVNQKAEASVAALRAQTTATVAHTAAVDTRSQAERFLAALEADAAKALTSTQLAHMARLKELGALTAQNAAGVGVSASQYAKYASGIREADKALGKKAETLSLVEPKLGSLTQFIRDAAKETEVWNTGLRFTSEVIGKLVPEIDQMTEKVGKLSDVTSSSPISKNAPGSVPVTLGGGKGYNIPDLAGAWEQYTNRYGHGFTGGPAPDFLAWAISMGIATPKAMGGPVTSGQSYVVGERGPELFTPSSSGSIWPNGGMGAMSFNITVNGHVMSDADLARTVGAAIMRDLRAGGMRLPAGA